MRLMDILRRWFGVEEAWDEELNTIRDRQNETRKSVMEKELSAQDLAQAVADEEERIKQRRADRRMDAQLNPRRRVTD